MEQPAANFDPSDWETRPGELVESRARTATRFLQRCLGAILGGLVLYKCLLTAWIETYGDVPVIHWIKLLYMLPMLELVGTALVISAALELACLLGASDLAVAVDPLIMSLAAAILFRTERAISREGPDGKFDFLIYILVLLGLFFIRKIFVEPRRRARHPGREKLQA